uniref:Tetraspanin-1 n=1 Tax=Hadrurus spadix TaxID=141984 RepID=A0A1W7R9G0_9SCOR
MFLNQAMRYYRLWIYCCNLVLLVSVLIFIVLAIWVVTDIRMALFPSIQLHQPTLIYAYFALALQGGILQAIGCVGALRMNERLLTIYWTLMLVLLLGDAIVGMVWLFRYQHLATNLRSDLRSRLQADYGVDRQFQDLWDQIQMKSKCCGVSDPHDYNYTSWMVHRSDRHQVVPRSCCRLLDTNLSCAESYRDDYIYQQGCYLSVHRWLQHNADMLSVLGFCVIAFLKLCFLGILRYEIKEMIQKIRILKDMDDQSPIVGFETHGIKADATHVANNCTPRPNYVITEPLNGNNNDRDVKNSCPV